MKYNELEVNKNTRPSRKGRGISAGQGKTAGRGTKGQKAHTGHRKQALLCKKQHAPAYSPASRHR